jgi:hypothetical protein
MRIHVDDIMALGLDFGGYGIDRRASINKLATKVAYFVSFYGHAPATFVPLFDDLCNSEAALDVLQRPPVLSEVLMMANWFKEGLTFNSLGGKFKMNPNTATKKCWKYAEAVAAMYAEKVRTFAVLVPPMHHDDKTLKVLFDFLFLFQIMFGPFPAGKVFILTVDGTHFRIKEPRSDPSSKWYSHKFNSPGLAYELAISTYENRICWTSGPFPASVHDITIYRGGLKALMPPGCKGIGDSGYAGETDTITVIRPGDSTELKKFKEAARARQENVNGRLKEFAILEKRWPYHRDKHAMVFKALVVMTQYDIETTRPLFDLYW